VGFGLKTLLPDPAPSAIDDGISSIAILALLLFVYSLQSASTNANLVARALWRRLDSSDRATASARARTGSLDAFLDRLPNWHVPGLAAALKEVMDDDPG
jgi:hypothetical protein